MSKRQFKISYKIALGFGLFLGLVTAVFFLTNNTLKEAKKSNTQIESIHAPSLSSLQNLDAIILRSLNLIQQIADKQTKKEAPERIELVNILSSELPLAVNDFESKSTFWSLDDQKTAVKLKIKITELTEMYWEILTLLPNFESYEHALTEMMVDDFFLDGQPMVEHPKSINKLLVGLINNQQRNLEKAITKMNNDFQLLKSRFFWLMILAMVLGPIIAVFVIRSIVKPIDQLKAVLGQMSLGIYPEVEAQNIADKQNNEIGDMAKSVNTLVNKLKMTREFTMNIGQGNLNVDFEPLSEHDQLGYALIKMRNSLANTERQLELKVAERTMEADTAREKATRLYQDLDDSIEYAKRIQLSFLTSPKNIIQLFPDAFVLYQPKEKVSGDFFWVKNIGEKRLVAAVDCTGHGVPGAFVSMVGNNVLNQVSKLYSKPSKILDSLHIISSKILRSGFGDEKTLRDGMDIALCMIDMETYELQYAGAYNPLYIIRSEELIQLRGDRFAIGSEQAYKNNYVNNTYQLQQGDVIYMFSDGYADQFGGDKGKKYMIKRFRNKLIEVSNFDMQTQKHLLEDELIRWKGAEEQVDDILVIGIRV